MLKQTFSGKTPCLFCQLFFPDIFKTLTAVQTDTSSQCEIIAINKGSLGNYTMKEKKKAAMLIWNHRTSPQWQPFCQRCSINKSWGIAGVLSIWLPLIRTYWELLDNSSASFKAQRGGIMYSGGIQQTGPYKPNLISPPLTLRLFARRQPLSM